MSYFLLADGEDIFKPYQFKMEEIEGLRYRSKVIDISLVYLHLEIYHWWLVGILFLGHSVCM